MDEEILLRLHALFSLVFGDILRAWSHVFVRFLQSLFLALSLRLAIVCFFSVEHTRILKEYKSTRQTFINNFQVQQAYETLSTIWRKYLYWKRKLRSTSERAREIPSTHVKKSSISTWKAESRQAHVILLSISYIRQGRENDKIRGNNIEVGSFVRSRECKKGSGPRPRLRIVPSTVWGFRVSKKRNWKKTEE